MEKDVERLIEAIILKRKTLGLSLRRLAEQSGVSFATLSRLEKFETEPDDGTKARLANWLGNDAKKLGLEVEKVLEVHFRAAKNIDSRTTTALVKLAEYLKKTYQDK